MASPSLKQLSYLLAVERTGSFSQAADDSHVTQSTLSAGIKELESITGCTLVDRSTRHAHLTPAGEEIASYASRILEDTEKLMNRARQMSKPMSGPLRIGVIPTIAPYLLPQILTPLQDSFPDLELQLQEDLTDRLLDKIKKGLLDAVLMAFPYETPDMETLILFDEPFLLACRVEDTSRPAPLKPADLEDEPLLLLEDGHCLRDHALQSCHLQESAARKTFSAASLPTLIQMVAHGYGSTLLPEMAAQEGIPRTIRLIPFKNPKPSRQIGLAWKKGAAQAHNVKILAKRIQELL
ncbi:MAG: hydrogen peroxide-inducible genes activator [Alphaproteobacteria bacterium]|nr:hydrogen peroxide-inducible genes activator [Alphaproteobacteria bacterium]